ncbi:MAG: class I SAM-dependent RNA methyltransferase [Chloroflexi bacterium]|nr:class I SAM-dependent RNA methyltransferase [Chloroflexota bacterium]
MSEPELFHFYVSCPPGLESVLASEYHALNFIRSKETRESGSHEKMLPGEDTGGMEFEGPLDHIYRANLHMRTAARVVVRLGDFIAITFSELRKKTSKLPWEKFILPGQTISLRVVCHKSRLYHSDAVAERVLGAINDHFLGSMPQSTEITASPEGQIILVRLVDDHCTISIDSSGELLHKRGYRQAIAKAPLRENLAAAMILASGWDTTSPLIDPFCGSGTIPIEAAMIARCIPPGIARPFQFLNWPIFEKSLWSLVLEEARKKINTNLPPLFGADRDTGAIEMANANAARAGQKGAILFTSQAVSYLEPSANPGWVITNPPYGVRTRENKDLRDLYARFGSILKEKFSDWRVCVLSSEDRLIGNLSLGSPEKTVRFSNGGIPVKFVSYKISS